MTITFEKLQALLKEKKTLMPEEVEAHIKEHGDMTDAEKVELEAQKLEIEKDNRTEEVTLEAYLAALKVLDSASEGSDEYKQAQTTVDKYEAGN